MESPVRPIDAYKAIIDELVRESRSGVSARLVLTDGQFSKAEGHEVFNAFVATLSPDQRETVAGMLRWERSSAIHAVLALLSWWLQTRDLGLTYRGEPMPTDLSDMGLHGDFIGRQQGWDWPTEEDD
jgi:hypothetical protein